MATTTILFAILATAWGGHGSSIPETRSTSCAVNDAYGLTKAFVGLQRIRDDARFPDGFAAIFHCEPVGLTNGDPVHMTCEKGEWIKNGTNVTVPTPICSRARVDDVLLHVHGDFVVGPAGVLFTKQRTFLNLTCEIEASLRNNNTTWKLKSYVTSNPRTQTVRIIKGSKVSVSLNDSEVVECQCTASNRKRKITIQAGDYHFCTEPVLYGGLRVLKRNATTMEFICLDEAKSYGEMTITCLESGQWDRSPPTCLQTETTRTLIASSKGGRERVTCPVYAFHEQVAQGVVIDAQQENVPEGSAFKARCDNPGFVVVGDTEMVACQKNGTWSFAKNLQCVIGCHNVTVNDESLIIEGLKRTYLFGDSITFHCPEGQRLEPHVERVICIDYGWLPDTVPKCVVKETDTEKTKRIMHSTKGTRRPR
ncbi:sushi, von Willebrand factor type A, EGF and pentraxin domain-containing protein 1-like [Ornithodoros turicata]|uniref:sushi, von Willebrand factor type A, EGF and pentraxin domain-containing protein 1-like n=1 Tax=Ornithodoros turicata TaxID=34597 RepID=UPI00313987A4